MFAKVASDFTLKRVLKATCDDAEPIELSLLKIFECCPNLKGCCQNLEKMDFLTQVLTNLKSLSFFSPK